jgi:hypothetical protein
MRYPLTDVVIRGEEFKKSYVICNEDERKSYVVSRDVMVRTAKGAWHITINIYRVHG